MGPRWEWILAQRRAMDRFANEGGEHTWCYQYVYLIVAQHQFPRVIAHVYFF